MKDRDIRLDVLKFIAALLITNSHMSLVYPQSVSALATGGAIGNCIFFFCSAYLIDFEKYGNRFQPYIKNRLKRIYPSVIVWTLIGSAIFPIGTNYHAWGGWFVPCIMIFYVVSYFLYRSLGKRFVIWFLATYFVGYVWLMLIGEQDSFSMFEHKLSWCMYFIPMIMGFWFRQAKNKAVKLPPPIANCLYYSILHHSFRYKKV